MPGITFVQAVRFWSSLHRLASYIPLSAWTPHMPHITCPYAICRMPKYALICQPDIMQNMKGEPNCLRLLPSIESSPCSVKFLPSIESSPCLVQCLPSIESSPCTVQCLPSIESSSCSVQCLPSIESSPRSVQTLLVVIPQRPMSPQIFSSSTLLRRLTNTSHCPPLTPGSSCSSRPISRSQVAARRI
jgi:hypothetical protein